MVAAESLRSTSPALRTWTPSFAGPVMVNFSTSPGAPLAVLRICPTWAPSPPVMTSFTGSVRLPGNSSSNCSCAIRVVLSVGR
ncbi:hypothetical protein RHDE110596_23900 [Prescottella defluvii]